MERIIYEKELLESMTGIQISSVSMHEPSRELLDIELEIPEMINSYSKMFFKEFMYCSDSRRVWRNSPDEIVKSKKKGLHILTHPVWWSYYEEGQNAALFNVIESKKIKTEEYIRKYYPDYEGK